MEYTVQPMSEAPWLSIRRGLGGSELGDFHGKLARKIAQEIGLSETEAMVLEVGSFSLRKKNRFDEQCALVELAENIIESRILFLEGSIQCFSSLGKVIQCVQETWIQTPNADVNRSFSDSHDNTYEVLSETELLLKIKKVSSEKARKDYKEQLDGTAAGPMNTDTEENSSQKSSSHLGLLDRIIEYASAEPNSAMKDDSIDFNLAYRLCLKVSCLVVTPVNALVHASSQVLDYEAEQKRLRLKLRRFPVSYLEQNGTRMRLEEIAVLREDDLAQLNEAFEQWINKKQSLVDCAIFPLQSSGIEDLGDGFRLRLRTEVREKTNAGFANPHELPDVRVDFSSFEEAKYAEEAFFEILLHQNKEPMRDRVGYIIDSLLNVNVPARLESLAGILETRMTDLKKDRAITNIISELKRIYDPTWDDLDNLRKRLASIRKKAEVKAPRG